MTFTQSVVATELVESYNWQNCYVYDTFTSLLRVYSEYIIEALVESCVSKTPPTICKMFFPYIYASSIISYINFLSIFLCTFQLILSFAHSCSSKYVKALILVITLRTSMLKFKILYSVDRMYFFMFYGSQNKQQSFNNTEVTYWLL